MMKPNNQKRRQRTPRVVLKQCVCGNDGTTLIPNMFRDNVDGFYYWFSDDGTGLELLGEDAGLAELNWLRIRERKNFGVWGMGLLRRVEI
jgi:hypothetical protein